MMTSIQFVKQGHDAFIDFLKAYCIICVILAHNLPSQNAVVFSIWGGMQVPLFLLIQTFHGLKNGSSKLNWKKISCRIIIPFAIIECLLLCYKLLQTDGSLNQLFPVVKSFICSGGFGPGSYYFWIYLQFAIILVILAPVFEKWSKQKLLLFFIAIGIGGEVFCSLVHIPEFLYRLLALRYLFLIYLGYIWVKNGIVINKHTILLSLGSMGTILFFAYTNYNLEPLFFQTDWKCHHWICYPYASILLSFLIYQLFSIVGMHSRLASFIACIGKASWEIYLIQMCVFVLIPKNLFSFITPLFIFNLAWIVITLTISTSLGLLLHLFLYNNK